jgi:histidinol-phosphate phosphatase family protein
MFVIAPTHPSNSRDEWLDGARLPSPPPARNRRRAVFLDRDGTLIADPGYLRDPKRVQVLPGSPSALRSLRRAGFLLVVVSNQSGIGRGLIRDEDARAVHSAFVQAFAQCGVLFDLALYCPHSPEHRCTCRKPREQMLVASAASLGADLDESLMIGDMERDLEAGRRAGCAWLRLNAQGQEETRAPVLTWADLNHLCVGQR